MVCWVVGVHANLQGSNTPRHMATIVQPAAYLAGLVASACWTNLIYFQLHC